MLGNIVAQKIEILDYDRVAIQALYGEKAPGDNSPLFCTDEDAGKIANCDRHDFGSTVAETAAEATRARLNALPVDIIEAYLAKVAPTLDTASKAIASVSLIPKESHETIFSARNDFYTSLSSSTPSLRHQLDFPYFGPLNEEKTKKRRFERMAEEVNATGGLTEVLPGVPRTYFAEVLAKLEELLKDENYLTGFGESGQPYTLASQDIATILENSSLLLKELEPIFVDEDLGDLQSIPSVWKVEGGLIEAQIRDVFKNRIDQYVFETKGTLDKVSIADAKTNLGKVEVSLPVFYYKETVREKASKLLDVPKASEGWASADRKALYDRYLAHMTAACGNCDFAKIKPSDLEVTPESEKKAVVSWFKENQSILDNFR